MSLTITAEQLDALYGQILDRLSGVGDIELAIEAVEDDTAEHLDRESSDDLRLLLDDLGSGRGTGDTVEMDSDPDVLRRVLPRLRELAEKHTASLEPEWSEVSEIRNRNRLVAEACSSILIELDGIERWRSGERHACPLSLSPRPRQACQRDDREGSVTGRPARRRSIAMDGVSRARPALAAIASALQGEDSRLLLNRLFLSGVLAEDPSKGEDRGGEPVTLLLVAFPAPDPMDTEERSAVASCEIEVPGEVMKKHGGELGVGDSIFVTAQLSGGGGVIATEVHSGPPPG